MLQTFKKHPRGSGVDLSAPAKGPKLNQYDSSNETPETSLLLSWLQESKPARLAGQ